MQQTSFAQKMRSSVQRCCTKWVEAKGLCENTTVSTTKFVYKHLWCRFGCLIEIISNQGGHFLNHIIRELTRHYTANGLAESTNKLLQTILKKKVNENHTNRDEKLHNAL